MTRRSGLANVAALALALGTAVAALVVTLDPRPPSSASFAHVGPPVFLDRLVAVPPTGPGARRTFLAGGSGLYTVSVAPAGGGTPRVTEARVATVPAGALVLGLEVAPQSAGPPVSAAPYRVFVGTVTSLLAAASPAGPYRRLPLHAGGVHGIAVDPSDASVIWATSYAGPERSVDGGRTWVVEARGMRAPTTSWAITFVPAAGGAGGTLVASDQDAVYVWTGSSWTLSDAQLAVVSLDAAAGGAVFASSMGAGIRVGLAGGGGTVTWKAADAGLPRTGGDPPGVHVVSVTAGSGTVYAGTMVDGLATSTDGGATWTVTWPALASAGDVWRLLPAGDVLVAATDNGVLAAVAPPPGVAGSSWLVAAIAGVSAAVVAGAAALAFRRRRRLAPAPARW